MPIYEFCCNSCHKESSVFVRSIGSSTNSACSYCGSGDLSRLMSGFATLRSEDSRLEDLRNVPDRPNLDYYHDPRNIGKWTEKRAKDLGFELPSEIKENIEQARSGKLPDDVAELGKVY